MSAALTILTVVLAAQPVEVTRLGDEVGNVRELFVDHALIDDISGDASLVMHEPEPREVVLTTDAPWEGNTSAYFTIFQDRELYRMYYRASHSAKGSDKPTHPEYTCYAESKDGVNWVKPKLGLVEFNGSRDNNIVWDGIGTHNFTPFRDDNPACPPEARYKALARGRGKAKRGLYAFQSPDGIHWKQMQEEPVITRGAFDSQNLAFWDPVDGCYRDYHRIFTDGVRAIMTCTSDDFLNWTAPKLLDYNDVPDEHLYTNAILRYPRAPQLLLGFPTRFQPETQQVEPILMASRDGRYFERWPEPLIPITAPRDRDGNRSNYMSWGIVEIPGEPDRLSMYASEAYYEGPDMRLRRFSLRKDGFVSLRGGEQGGVLTTRPVQLKQASSAPVLNLNLTTQQDGFVRVGITDSDGKPIKGFGLEDCEPVTGDQLEQPVRWKGGSLGQVAGKPIRLQFEVRNADLYAYAIERVVE